MRYRTLLPLLASIGLGALLSGCVVAPLAGPYAYGAGGPVYAQPGPVVVTPAIGFYGYYGYGGGRGGHGGHGHR